MKTTLLKYLNYLIAVCVTIVCSLNLHAESTPAESCKTDFNPENTMATSLVRFTAGYSDNINSFDPFVIYYDSYATENFDGMYDALKLFNTDESVVNFYVFANDSARLSINGLPYDGTPSGYEFKVGTRTKRSGMVEFRIKDISGLYLDQPIYLKDIVAGTIWNLSTDGNYNVYLPAGIYENRFYLSIGSVTTDISPMESDDCLMKAYSGYGLIKVELNLPSEKAGMLTIFDTSGRPLLNKKVNGTNYEFLPPRKGIYLITLEHGNSRITEKVVCQ